MGTEVFDACVVGSGAGGGALAWKLARAGLRVLVLERGPHYRARDFFHDELAVCRRDYFVPNPARDPHLIARGNGAFERSADAWIACCVGGGTVHMSGYFFRMKSLAGWPVTLDALAPFYDEVEREIGVSTLLSHPSAAWIEAGARKLGLNAFPIRRAIVSSEYRGRQACTYCGFCGSYGCEVGAKSSTLETFLRDARLTLKPRCRVTRVLVESGRAAGVLFLDEKSREQRARARVVAVACSAIETARLLLASDVANSSGLVGKNLMFATLASGYGRFPRGDTSSDRLPFIDRAVEQAEGVILFQRPHPNPIFQAEKLAWNPSGPPAWGSELKKRMREFFHETRTLEWESFSDFAPHAGCEVSLDPDVKDPAGQPAARVRIGVHPDSLATSDKLAARAREIMAAAGALRQGQTSDERVYTVLQCGTARMGTDAAKSVVDPACQAHDVKGLYVADSSSFCSSGSAPFTFTIMANALRVGAGIIERMRKREL